MSVLALLIYIFTKISVSQQSSNYCSIAFTKLVPTTELGVFDINTYIKKLYDF